MSIKEMFHELINKKWTGEDLCTIVLSIVCASFLTTPILGIPIGIAVYFLFFYKQEGSNIEIILIRKRNKGGNEFN